jgi:hypothetical protein
MGDHHDGDDHDSSTMDGAAIVIIGFIGVVLLAVAAVHAIVRWWLWS